MILKELATLDSYGQDPELNIGLPTWLLPVRYILFFYFLTSKQPQGLSNQRTEQNSWTGNIEKTELIDAKKKESSCWG